MSIASMASADHRPFGELHQHHHQRQSSEDLTWYTRVMYQHTLKQMSRATHDMDRQNAHKRSTSPSPTSLSHAAKKDSASMNGVKSSAASFSAGSSLDSVGAQTET